MHGSGRTGNHPLLQRFAICAMLQSYMKPPELLPLHFVFKITDNSTVSFFIRIKLGTIHTRDRNHQFRFGRVPGGSWFSPLVVFIPSKAFPHQIEYPGQCVSKHHGGMVAVHTMCITECTGNVGIHFSSECSYIRI